MFFHTTPKDREEAPLENCHVFPYFSQGQGGSPAGELSCFSILLPGTGRKPRWRTVMFFHTTPKDREEAPLENCHVFPYYSQGSTTLQVGHTKPTIAQQRDLRRHNALQYK
jgi:hypothetical protein